MKFFVVTTSLYNDCNVRKQQYINGINTLKQVIQDLNIENYKIIIIENNGKRDTFLNSLGCEVFYTINNFIQTNNKDIKELTDIRDCIEHYKTHQTAKYKSQTETKKRNCHLESVTMKNHRLFLTQKQN